MLSVRIWKLAKSLFCKYLEELFLPQAEYTKYLKEDIGDIIDYGEWNIRKRPEKFLKKSFEGLDSSDWILFRATDNEGNPLCLALEIVQFKPETVNWRVKK